MIFTLALVSALSTQHFTCFPDDIHSNERAIISLNADNGSHLPEVGTLYLTEGLDSNGNQANSGILPLTLDTESAEDPNARGEVRYNGEDESTRYSVTLPLESIGQASKSLRIRLTLENADHSNHQDFEMSCYSSLGGEAPR